MPTSPTVSFNSFITLLNRKLEFKIRNKKIEVSAYHLNRVLMQMHTNTHFLNYVADLNVTVGDVYGEMVFSDKDGKLLFDIKVKVKGVEVLAFGATPDDFYISVNAHTERFNTLDDIEFVGIYTKKLRDILSSYVQYILFAFNNNIENGFHEVNGMYHFSSKLDTGNKILDYDKKESLKASGVLGVIGLAVKKFEQFNCDKTKIQPEGILKLGSISKHYVCKKGGIVAEIAVYQNKNMHVEEWVSLEIRYKGHYICSIYPCMEEKYHEKKPIKHFVRLFGNLAQEDEVKVPESLQKIYDYINMVFKLTPGMHFM